MRAFFLILAHLALTCILGVKAHAASPMNGVVSCEDAHRLASVTHHEITLQGKPFAYRARADFMPVASADGTKKACLFFIAYEAESATVARPVFFAYNGGPGSSSAYIHLGFLGPQRLDTGSDGLNLTGPLHFAPNESSPLSHSDVVLIDPVGSGLSFAEGADTDFFNTKNDTASVSSLVLAFLKGSKRPVFIGGESYGGARSILVARDLIKAGVNLRGLFLLSPYLSDRFAYWNANNGKNPEVYTSAIPSMAAVALYQQKLSASLAQVSVAALYDRAVRFSSGSLLAALKSGQPVPDAVLEKEAALIGMPAAKLRANQISADIFQSDLLADKNRQLGMYDGRLTYPSSDDDESSPDALFAQGIRDYLQHELNFAPGKLYRRSATIENWGVNDGIGAGGNGFDGIPTLEQAMTALPSLKIFAASGYYDLVIPAHSVTLDLQRLSHSERVKRSFYEGGHMVYLNPKALNLLSSDLGQFLQSAAR